MQGGSCCHQGSLLKGTIYRTRSPRKMDASGSGAFPGPLVGCCLRRQNPATCSIGLQWRRQPQPLPGRLCLMKKQTITPKSDRGLLFPTPPLPQYPARAPAGRLSRKERAYSSPKVETRFLRGKLCNRFCRGINYSPQGLLEKEKQIRGGGGAEGEGGRSRCWLSPRRICSLQSNFFLTKATGPNVMPAGPGISRILTETGKLEKLCLAASHAFSCSLP